MRARVQRWGNSLALRIPKAFASATGMGAGSEVELVLEDGALIVRTVEERTYLLEGLLAGITSENLHSSVDTGAAVGREAW